MRKALLPLIAAVVVLPAIASAGTITGVTFQGPANDPTITITGSGFLPEPAASGFITDPGFGQDFGPDITTFSLNDTGAFSFGAGQDGDTIGLTNLTYGDTLISYQLGVDYELNYHIEYALDQGDVFTVWVNGASFTGKVNYANPIPEPSSLALLGTGVLGALGMARRRFLHA